MGRSPDLLSLQHQTKCATSQGLLFEWLWAQFSTWGFLRDGLPSGWIVPAKHKVSAHAWTTTLLRQEELQKYNIPCVDFSRGRHQSQPCWSVVSRSVPACFLTHALQVYKAHVWMDVLYAMVGLWSTKINVGITPKGNHSQKRYFLLQFFLFVSYCTSPWTVELLR